MSKREPCKEKFKDIIDINSEVDWLKFRGNIDKYLLYSDMNTNKYLLYSDMNTNKYLLYSDMNTNKFIVARRFYTSVTMMQCTQTTDSLVNLL